MEAIVYLNRTAVNAFDNISKQKRLKAPDFVGSLYSMACQCEFLCTR